MQDSLSGTTPPGDAPATLELPLRGLAAEGAAETVEPALLAIPGVLAVDVRAAHFRVRVTYDSARVTVETIRERLHALFAPDTAHGGA